MKLRKQQQQSPLLHRRNVAFAKATAYHAHRKNSVFSRSRSVTFIVVLVCLAMFHSSMPRLFSWSLFEDLSVECQSYQSKALYVNPMTCNSRMFACEAMGLGRAWDDALWMFRVH